MVLQHGVSVPVWGKAAPGARVYVKIMDKRHRVVAGTDGRWRVLIDAQPPGGPYEMTVSVSGQRKVFRDIYFGDVWVCAGQSNMEMPMQRLQDDFPEEWGAQVNHMIRQFKVPQEWDFHEPRDFLSGGSWTVASCKTLDEFPGTGWFFAKEIFKNHATPIGLINTAWGGTPVEAWMSKDALSGFPEKLLTCKKYANPAACNTIVKENEAEIKSWYDALVVGDRGLVEKWHKPQDAISQWGKITLPGCFSKAGIDKFYGAVWFRRSVEVPAELVGKDSKLWLGTIVDADTVYVNGVEVGGTAYQYPPRKYAIPAGLLRAGKNSIVIRVICCSGNGGITEGKDFRIFSGEDSLELGGTWEYRVGMRAAKPCPETFFFQRQPSGLFNAMIAPMLDFPCRGILWYQGESNDSNSKEYKALFAAHVADWQARWRRADEDSHGGMPFLFVQLPIFGKPGENSEQSSWAALRDAQFSALSLPSTGMATGLDLGEWNDIHPANKKEVGRRLAMAAERLVFKNRNSAPGPVFLSLRQSPGLLTLSFDNCGGGLVAEETPYLTVVAGGTGHRLPAAIKGPDCLLVDVSSIQNPEKVLYAWANNPLDRQLFNSDGLPMVPFRVDIGSQT